MAEDSDNTNVLIGVAALIIVIIVLISIVVAVIRFFGDNPWALLGLAGLGVIALFALRKRGS